MGNSQSEEEPRAEYISISHPKFKDIKLIKEDDIIRSMISIEHESDYEQWEQKLNKITSLDDEVILLPRAYQYTRKAICGSSGTIQIDYDNYPYILAQELKNRQKVNRYFEQSQIWYLLYSLVTAAHDFQKINSKIGDVRPENIFINQQGHVKVSNMYSWPGEVSNYTKTVYDNQRTYLSPQEAQAARQGQSQTYLNKFQAESFSIGLTALQSAMIRPLSYLYLQDKTFDSFNFSKLIKQWWNLTFLSINEQTEQASQKKYSDALKLTIASLCEINPQERLLSDEVYNWLKYFHKEINELLPFQAGMPPIKNMNKYGQFIKNVAPNNSNNYGNANNTNMGNYNKIGSTNANKFQTFGYGNSQNINMPANTKPRLQPNQLAKNGLDPPVAHNLRPPQNNFNVQVPKQQITSAIPTTSNYIPNTTQNKPYINSTTSNYPNHVTVQPQFILNQHNAQTYTLSGPKPFQNGQPPLTNNLASLGYGSQPNTNGGASNLLKQIDQQLARSRQGFK